jgi:hypothetical protein
MNTAVETNNLGKRYGDVTAVDAQVLTSLVISV